MKNMRLKAAAVMLVFLIAGVLYSADRSQDFLFSETGETVIGETDTISEAAQQAGEDVAAISGTDQETAAVEGSDQKLEDMTGTGSVNTDQTSAEDAGDSGMTEQTSLLRVHVCGAVKQAGVYLLSQDAIVEDAIKAAGGVTKDGAGDYLNLADTVYDGEKIYVPFLKDLEHPYGVDPVTGRADSADGTAGDSADGSADRQSDSGDADGTGGPDGGDAGTSADESGNSDSSDKVNINTAGKEQLMTLPGIGETRGEAIISYREKYGVFSSIEDIMKVSGIKEGAFGKIKDSITV